MMEVIPGLGFQIPGPVYSLQMEQAIHTALIRDVPFTSFVWVSLTFYSRW